MGLYASASWVGILNVRYGLKFSFVIAGAHGQSIFGFALQDFVARSLCPLYSHQSWWRCLWFTCLRRHCQRPGIWSFCRMCPGVLLLLSLIFSSPDVFGISSYGWSWSVVSPAKMSAQLCFTLHCGSTAYVCWATAPHPGLAHFKNKKLLGLLSFSDSLYVLHISPSSGKHFVVFSVCGLSLLIVDVVLFLKSSEQLECPGSDSGSLLLCEFVSESEEQVEVCHLQRCSCSWGPVQVERVTHTSMWSSQQWPSTLHHEKNH